MDLAPISGAIARGSAARSDATAPVGVPPAGEVRGMAPKYHHPPISGGDRKALKKELSKSRATTRIFAERSAETRREGEALIREADNFACQSWNEKMWSDGGPIDPSPTIDQAINGGFPWLEIKCSRCQTSRDVDLCALPHVPTTWCTISPDGWFARSARRLESARLRCCCS
jgi:hypothetical protein